MAIITCHVWGEYVPYGTPVIILGPAKAAITLKAENLSQAYALANEQLASQNLLAGTYPGKTLAIGEGYYLKSTGANIYRASTVTTLPPFSCYLPSAEKRTYFKLEESEDGISRHGSSLQYEGEEIFDLQGRKLSKAQKGIHVQGNKKILIK